MSRSRHGGRPPGELEKITDAWKQRVQLALEAPGRSQQWLADQLAIRLKRPGMKRDTINKLLRKQKHSVLVPHITAILNLDAQQHTQPTPDGDRARLIELMVRQSPERVRALLLLLEDGSRQD